MEIAQQLKSADKKVQLIYAFNSTGKTRLSCEFKRLIAPKKMMKVKNYPSHTIKFFITTPLLKICFIGIMI